MTSTGRLSTAFLVLLSLLSLGACDDPAQKEAKYLRRGDELTKQGDYNKARLEYKNAARVNPTSLEVRYRLGLLEEESGNLQDAFAAFIAAEQQDENYTPASLKIAQYFLAARAPERAQERIDRALLKDPENAQAHALQASALLQMKKTDEAEKEARRALSKDKANVTAYAVLTGVYQTRKETDKAFAVVEEGIQNTPQDVSLYLLRVALAEQARDPQRWRDAYKALIALKPKELSFRNNYAKVLQETGQADKAEALLRETVEAVPEPLRLEAQKNLVLFLDDTKGLEAAEKEIRSLLAATKSGNEYSLWLANLYMKHKKTSSAVETLEKMVKEMGLSDEKPSLDARTSLARIRLSQGDRDLAKDLASEVLKNDVNNKGALFLRAEIASQEGRLEDAIADLRTILRDDPKTARAGRILAEVLLHQGLLNLAIDTLARSVAATPEDIDSQIRLTQLYALQGEAGRALGLLETINKLVPENAVGWESTARVAIGAEKWEVAQKAIAVLRSMPDQKDMADFLQAEVLNRTGKAAEAEALYERVVRAAPMSALAEHGLSARMTMAKDKAETEKAVAFLESLPQKSFYARTLWAEALIALKKKPQAIDVLDPLLAEKPKFQAPYIDRARLWLERPEGVSSAFSLLEEARRAAPADLDAPMFMADLLTQHKKYQQALDLYRDILRHNPKADIAANNMAQMIADNPNATMADLETARLASERFLGSSNPLLLDTLAWVYFKQGRLGEAQAVMERVMAAGGDKLPAQILYHHGALLLKLGHPHEARQALEKATRADVSPYPGLEEAKALLKGI